METKAITEIYGEFRTGKTQICLTMCVTCQLSAESGGASGKVAFIDTEGTFRPERIRPIAVRYNLDPDAVLENIVVARAFTHEHQMGTRDEAYAPLQIPQVLVLISISISIFRSACPPGCSDG